MVNDPVGSPADLYRKGNESFVSEDYDRAIELYTDALAQDPSLLECYAAKAQAYIKTERFELAKRDADRGVDMLRGLGSGEDRTASETKKCLQRSGVASFHLGKYKEAKNCFAEAVKFDVSDKGLTQWVSWCEEKIAKFGDDASRKQSGDSDKPSESGNPSDTPVSSEPSKEEEKPSPNPAPAPNPEVLEVMDHASPNSDPAPTPPQPEQSLPMPTPTVKHDWYQTETHVIIEVRIKKLRPEDVQVEFHDGSLSVTAKLAVGADYSLEIDLSHPVVPAQCAYKVLSTKLEVKLRKAEGVRWNALEGDGAAPVLGAAAAPVAAPAGGIKGPYASGRDWSKVEKLLDAEADEKKEGEAALNEMFQKIYADANDDVRKAMNKSFAESGGTVLSTNWSEIGKDKVDVKPPDGMEFKKWEG